MNRTAKIVVTVVSVAVMGFIVIGSRGVRASGSEGAYKQLGVFSEVLNRVRADYVEEPNMDSVRDGSLTGLVESLDSNSSYLSPTSYKAYKDRASGNQGAGTGLTLAKRYGFAAVVAVLPGSPADKAGIDTGDIIEAVEGKSTREVSLAEIRSLMTGERGSTVKLTVIHPRKAEPQEVAVTRDNLAWPAASERLLESAIGYIKPGSFAKDKAQEIAAKIKVAQAAGAKKLVIDLRNNAEGSMSEAVAAANLFLDHGTIATLKGQTVAKEDFTADPAKAVSKLPMVVLVNRGTAGPAEVFAAALLENARADVIGEKTFGMASVQKTIEMGDGSALILSVAKYYTPSGKAIQDVSITPNITVAGSLPSLDGEDESADENPDAAPKEKPTKDEQLQRAIEVLKAKNS